MELEIMNANKTGLSLVTLLVSCLYIPFSLSTQIVDIPDKKFHACLNGYLKEYKLPQAPITDTQLASLTGALSCAETGTADITGAEYLVNIDFLNVEYNQLTSLDAIAGLTNLTRLAVGGNHISSGAPLKGLVNLTDLDMNNNDMLDGDFISEMVNLESLDLSANMIKTYPGIGNLRKLKNLYLQNSNILEIADFATLTQLEQLYIDSNHIADMSPLAGMLSLTALIMGGQDVQLNPIPNSGVVTINNPIVSVDGTLVPPTSITNGGIYKDGQIIWTNLPAGTDSVSFEFGQRINIDGLDVPFDGSVTQYLE
jgi:internalin A